MKRERICEWYAVTFLSFFSISTFISIHIYFNSFYIVVRFKFLLLLVVFAINESFPIKYINRVSYNY